MLALPWVAPLAAAVVPVGLPPGALEVSSLTAPLGVVVLVGVVVWWGRPPWTSRVLAPAGAGWRHCRRRGALVVVAAAAVGLTIAAGVTGARPGLGAVALLAAELALVFASSGVRRWTFTPRHRAGASWLVAAVAVAALVAPSGDGAPLVAPMVGAFVAVVLGLAAARFGDARTSRRAARDRSPEHWSALRLAPAGSLTASCAPQPYCPS